MPTVTIKDVAKAAQLSLGTVSMALNGKGSVNPETREKVLLTAREMGYLPNKHAQLLNSKRTKVIGLIVTDITNPFFGVIIDNVQEELTKSGYEMMLGISKGSITREKEIMNRFIEMQVDGAIIVPSHKPAPNTAHLHNLLDRNIPICFITTYYTDIQAPCVMTDLAAGSYQLTRYLLETGHQRIVYIVANRSMPVSNLRVEGYLSAYRESGVSFSPNWVVISEPTFEGGYASTNKILSHGWPDAILAMNDIMAMGVLKHLKENNINVPGDISVAGYDDILFASIMETPLTTVEQPMRQMCQKAVEVILSKIEKPDGINEKVLIVPRLVLRNSTAPRLKQPV